MHDLLTLWAQWSQVQAGKVKGYPRQTLFRARLGGGVSTPVLSDTAGAAIDAAVSALPHDEREAVCLHYLKGLPPHAIGEQQRRSHQAVAATLKAARQRVAGNLGVA